MGGIAEAKDDRAARTDADGTAPPPVGGPPAGGRPALGPGRVRLVFAGLTLALLLAALEQTTVATALPAVAADLHGPDRLPWVVTAYLLAVTVGLPVHAALGDRWSRKAVFQFAVVVFVVGSALAGSSRTMDQLIAFRALQGIGAGGLVTGAQTLTADLVPARARGRFMGLAGAAFAAASVGGPLLGGFLVEQGSWRWCFYVNVPAGLITLTVVALALRLPEPPVRLPARPDVLGVFFLTAASACLVLMTRWGGKEHAWDSRVVLGLACGAVGTLLLFLVVESLAPRPLVPPYLFRDSVFVLTGLIGLIAGVVLYVAGTCLPAFFQLAQGADAAESGLLMLPLMGGLAVAATVSGLLISRTGHYKIHPVIGTAVAAVGMWLLSRLEPDTPRLDHSVWQAVLGTGIGLVIPALVLAAQNSAPPADLSTATGAHTYLRQAGGLAAAAVFGTLLAGRLDQALADRPPGGEGLPTTALPEGSSITPQMVHALPPALRDGYLQAYADTMPRTFLLLVPLLALGLVLAFFLKEKPLVFPDPPVVTTVPVPAARVSPAPPAPPRPAPAFVAGVPVCGTVQHPDGSSVPRAALTLVDVRGQQIGRGASGEDGRYALSVPGAGAYVMIAAAGGHQPQAVTVTVGDRPVELDVVLGGAGRLAGTVVTADGTPVRDAAVTLTDVRGEVVASTRTGREGGYEITELVAGEYTLAASAPAFRPAALPVSVQASRETRQDIELAGGAMLRGTVRATGGRPVEEARVTLLDTAGNVVDTLTTGPDGTFRFVDLSSGEYTVIAAGYPPVATVLQVARGGRTERDLQLGYED
ncbi:MFS transporter [Streptomyces sp. SP18CS02]|uniref:MFS transporter n=1 Tax=Streptomyces sp. SP18CS02 TaxID=3002531 RepID=UPI002E786717|nr:MFS transporter [Streptomyces sp. SP18CS02]MEE1753911.1 MFS transporter [Streptomyces sp. SP18CS02]